MWCHNKEMEVEKKRNSSQSRQGASVFNENVGVKDLWCHWLGFLTQKVLSGDPQPPAPTHPTTSERLHLWVAPDCLPVRNIPVPLYTSVPCTLPASLGLATRCITRAPRVYSWQELHPSHFPIHTRSSQTHLYSPPVVSKQAAPACRLRVASASNTSTPSDCAHVIRRFWFWPAADYCSWCRFQTRP